ncbi:M56 family metallopeptidase [Gimesia aquarii]|uniref:Regulatory protein BlaR1 n=1 Tax=Gimesia aquarii TaxID=2527964 RepID=A0A517VPY0_9PLAN|nr:M56 family metallopeptidase [Gimesia aquarii]QDT95043.1 Regulatory protein BlaR1 [Gimesia aquarii]
MNLSESTFVQIIWQQFWQCSLLVFAVFLICKFIKFRQSHLTFILWLIVLLKFMTPPLWSSSSGLFCWVQGIQRPGAHQALTNQDQHALTLTESIRQLIGDDVQKLPDVEATAPAVQITVHDGSQKKNPLSDIENSALKPDTTLTQQEWYSARPFFWYSGFVLWGLIAASIVAVMVIRYWQCRQILRTSSMVHDPELDQLLSRLSVELRVKRRVRLLITKSRIGPAVIGLFRPTIILPQAIVDSRSKKELEPILAHELIHIRRGDLWVGLLQLTASIVWWFHPLVWFTGRRLKLEVEQCCDEEVLAELDCEPGLYAKCLLEVLELKHTLKSVPVVPGVRPVEITSKRLERIMKLGQGCQKQTPWWCWMVLIVLSATVLPGAAFVVSAADQQAEKATKSTNADLLIIQNKSKEKETSSPNQTRTQHQDKNISSSPSSSVLKFLYATEELQNPKAQTVRVYSIKELMEKGYKDVGESRAKAELIEKVRSFVNKQKRKEEILPQPNTQLANPLMKKAAGSHFAGRLFIKDDHFIVLSEDPGVHKHAAQAIQELSESVFTKLQIITKIKVISVPQTLISKISDRRKEVKVIEVNKFGPMRGATKTNDPFSDSSEIENKAITFETLVANRSQSLIYELLDTKRAKEIQKMIQATESTLLSSPVITMMNGQTASIAQKEKPVFENQFAGAGQRFQLNNYGFNLNARPMFPEKGGNQKTGRLEYEITFSKNKGVVKQNTIDLNSKQRKVVELPMINEFRFADSTQIQLGETLLVGGFKMDQNAKKPQVLLLMIQLEKVKPVTDLLMFGIGVNSDVGVIGHIIIDESNFEDNLITKTYPVADLVVPLPRKIVTSQKLTPTMLPPVKPRFEPLIELIKKNVTPENWRNEKKQTGSIMAYKETLSLVVRHTREAHDQITELLQKLRAFQDLMIYLDFQLVQTDHLQKWFKEWERSEVRALQDLLKQLKARNLKEGILLDLQHADLMKQMAQRTEHLNILQAPKLSLFNGQSIEFDLKTTLESQKNSPFRIQLRTELPEKQTLRLSMAINANDALDVLSNLKSMAIPNGKSVLIDITDQVSGREPAFLPFQFSNQNQPEPKKHKRYFLLISPSVMNLSESEETLNLEPPGR